MEISEEKVDQIRARYYKMMRKRDRNRRAAEEAREEGNSYTAKHKENLARNCNVAAQELGLVIQTLGLGYGDESDHRGYVKTA